ncbi:MAG: exo-alpha-sialidase [Planctomycetota bacterium]|nr:MAG: exo-alpha-sialidase [Planctomycetota bacterium]
MIKRSKISYCHLVLLLALAVASQTSSATRAAEPQHVPAGPRTRPIAVSDGSLRAFRASNGKIVSVRSEDGGRTWSPPQLECNLPIKSMGGGLSLLDAAGEIHLILVHARGEGKPAETRFIDLWHCRTTDGQRAWTKPERIWEGYCGAVMDIKQLSSGRIVVPFAAWKRPGEEVAPSTGLNYTTVVYSDDGGDSWHLSPAKLTSPCQPGYNGNNYGAIEPTVLELNDGRVWMLMRTQTGFLYESFSEDGVNWTAAEPSPFHSSTSPAALDRLPDGRIVLVWNNCEMPPRHEGAGVYGGRDALHAALSADEGKTWHGFREVYRDPYRNDSPPPSGDRGTAYPQLAVGPDGEIVLVTGQGNRKTMILVDPDWLLEQDQADDFSQGLEAWHVWKPFGPATGYWRDRCEGPVLVEHPTRAGALALHVRRPDQREADCASWNFAGRDAGCLDLRILPRPGSAGIDVCLNDRFFNPSDERGESEAVFRLTIPPSGKLGETTLPADQWSTLQLQWDLTNRRCEVALNGQPAGVIAQQSDAFGGVSYLRLRSRADSPDAAGYLIDSVRVSGEPPR